MHDQIHGVVARRGLEVEAVMEMDLAAPIKPVFDFIAAEDVLPKVLTGYGLLPGVVSTSGNTGPWDQAGSSRTVHLADGNTAREEVTNFERPNYFAYRTSEYTFALRYLATGAKGQWWLKENNGSTHIRWSYTFTAKGAVAALILVLFVRTQWVGYMRVCLENTRKRFTLN